MHLLFALPLVFILALMAYIYYYDIQDKKLMEDITFRPPTKEEQAIDALIAMCLTKEDKDADPRLR